MDPISGSPVLLFLEELALKSSVILALGLAAAGLAKRRTASFRHFVLSLTLLSLLVFPFVSLAPFGWETRILPGRAAGRALPAEPVPAGFADRQGPARPAGMAAEPGPVESGPGAEVRAGFAGWIVPAAWAAGAAFILFRLAAGLFGARRLTREGETVADPIWRVIIERFLAAVGLRRTVRLKSHRDVVVPLTWGLFRPVILIPSGHERWTDDERSSALFHELSHIKRADFLIMMLVRLSLAAFWFNPLSWIVLGRIRKEQEKACDELVLRAGVKPSTYAANLLLFKRAAGFRWDPSAALLGLFGGSSFNERLSAILRQRLAFKEVTMKTKIMLAAAIVLTVAFIGCARPASTDVQTAPPAAAAAAAPAPAQAPAAAPAQEAKPVAREKKPEKAEDQKVEAKKPGEKKIDVLVKTETETIPLEITIVQDGQTKTVRLSDALTLKEGPEGRVLVVTPGGKEIKLAGGGPVRIEIKGGEIELIPEAGGLEKKIVILGDQAADVIKLKEDSAKLRDEIKKKVRIEIGERTKMRDEIRKRVEAEIGAREMSRDVIRKKIAVELEAQQLKELSEARAAVAKAAKARAVIVGESSAALKEQMKKVREMLNEVKEKKRDLVDLEKAVEELEAGLAAREAKPVREMRIARTPQSWTITRPDVVTVIREKEGGAEAEAVVRPRVGADVRADALTIKTIEEGGAATIVAVSGKGKSRADYERAVVQLKKDLPEGLALEPAFVEESGIITITVKGAGKTGIPEDIVKKIAAALKDETTK